MRSMEPTESLMFALDVEDGWPPAGVECLPFRVTHEGYIALAPPLFVKDVSVGDVIDVTRDDTNGLVFSWRHVEKSERTTTWLLRLKSPDMITAVLPALQELGCKTVGFEPAGAYSVDVPESVPIAAVDAVLEQLDSASVAVAFPSMRHESEP